jgi:hypothetical protein
MVSSDHSAAPFLKSGFCFVGFFSTAGSFFILSDLSQYAIALSIFPMPLLGYRQYGRRDGSGAVFSRSSSRSACEQFF